MWKWISETLDRLCRSDNISSVKGIAEADDIKQEVCLYLLSNPEIAEDIYKNKKTNYLNRLVIHSIYDKKGRNEYRNKWNFSCYQRIQSICEMYHIPMTVENAYKISHMMEYENYRSEDFSIQNIIKFLNARNQPELSVAYDENRGTGGDSYD